jgi:hypothetical protein
MASLKTLNLSTNGDKKGTGSNQSSPRVRDLVGSMRKTASGTEMAASFLPNFKPAFDRKRLNVGMRKWLKFDKKGETSILQVCAVHPCHTCDYVAKNRMRRFWSCSLSVKHLVDCTRVVQETICRPARTLGEICR